jgi:hypothetical protein
MILTRRRDPDRADSWLIYFDGVHIAAGDLAPER